MIIVFTNLPDQESAEKLAHLLVEERLAACVNILAPCRSIYRWQGELNVDGEIPVIIKTTEARYPELERRIRELHPYELPEIVATAASQGLPAYLDWVVQETRA